MPLIQWRCVRRALRRSAWLTAGVMIRQVGGYTAARWLSVSNLVVQTPLRLWIVAITLALSGASARGQSNGALLFEVSEPEGHGFINRSGDVVIPLRYHFALGFADGLAPVWVEPQRCGYIDTTGLMIIEPRFKYCRPFSHGVAAVQVATGWTFIRRSGTPITSYVFDEVGGFAEDRGPVRVDNMWGYIDGTGNFVISLQYRLAWGFYQGRAIVYQADEAQWPDEVRCTIIDTLGGVVSRPDGGDCRGSSESVMVLRGKESKYAYVRADGTLMTPFKYEWAEPFVNGLAAVRLDGRIGFIDPEGRIAIPLRFDRDTGAMCNRDFSEGLIPVMIRGRCGYIDGTGAVAIPPRFDIARGFHDGLAFVCADRRCGYVDSSGSIVWMSKQFN
jgi:hypothetical protein